MSKIRTGDLYLGNRWSLQSLLTKVGAPQCRWTEVGLFVVNDSDPDEPEISVYFADQNVEKVTLKELLSEVNVQAAAHRPLREASPQQVAEIRSYLARVEGLVGCSLSQSIEVALPSGKEIRTTMGERVDHKGRALSNNPRLKNGFSSVDLVVSALSAAGIIGYNPEVELADFQMDSDFDDIFGVENPLMPTAAISKEQIVQLAQDEAKVLIELYLERQPQLNLKNIKVAGANRRIMVSTPKVGVGRGRPGDDIPMVSAQYIEQMPAPVLEGINRGIANQLADEEISKANDSRVRKRDDQLKQFARPLPGFKR